MRKYLLLFLSLFIFISPVYASTNTKNREDFDNYGVNKKWVITDKNISNVKKTPMVDASELIYDFSDILTQEEEDALYQEFLEFKKETGFDIVFVSYDLPYSDDDENDVFTADFYDYNDFGIDNPDYDGIILFRNTWVTDRYYLASSFGKAQLYLYPERLDDITDAIYDNIHENRYPEAIRQWMSLCKEKIAEGPNKNYFIDDMGYLHYYYRFPTIIIIILSGVSTLIFILINVGKNNMVKKVFKAGEYINKKDLKMLESKDYFIHSHVTSYTVSSSSGGGGGSRGGSSGGGHSSSGRHG